MTAKELHGILSSVLAISGDVEVMVDTSTFMESENGTIFEIESAEVQDVQGADDSGPVGEAYPMLVIRGPVEWHEHGTPL
jgi:hypothetical protein